MRKLNYIAIISLFAIVITAAATVSAQFTIKLPDISIKKKPIKTMDPTGNGKTENTIGNTTGNQNGRPKGRENIYKLTLPNATPVLLKNSIYVQAVTHNEYWKMPNQKNYSSWVPRLRFDVFFNNDRRLNYSVQYFNPDGSPWYSEKLEYGGTQDAERTVLIQSPSPWTGTLDTKSTAAVGTFSFKVTDDDSKEVVYQGKFKVGKFSTAHNGEKNKVDFFVDHDWIIPFGTIGFHHSLDPVGAMPLLVSFWLKGDVEASQLEGRVFYKGQQIATTADDGGGASAYDERRSEFAAAFAPQNVWKRWQFQWRKFLFDNNGSYNPDNFQGAFFADKNPGEYTVKIYRNGTQIRELSFTIGPDGRYAVPQYSGQVFMPYHRIYLPVKVVGAEKWAVNDWKTDAFYGNPVTGFTVN